MSPVTFSHGSRQSHTLRNHAKTLTRTILPSHRCHVARAIPWIRVVSLFAADFPCVPLIEPVGVVLENCARKSVRFMTKMTMTHQDSFGMRKEQLFLAFSRVLTCFNEPGPVPWVTHQVRQIHRHPLPGYPPPVTPLPYMPLVECTACLSGHGWSARLLLNSIKDTSHPRVWNNEHFSSFSHKTLKCSVCNPKRILMCLVNQWIL